MMTNLYGSFDCVHLCPQIKYSHSHKQYIYSQCISWMRHILLLMILLRCVLNPTRKTDTQTDGSVEYSRCFKSNTRSMLMTRQMVLSFTCLYLMRVSTFGKMGKTFGLSHLSDEYRMRAFSASWDRFSNWFHGFLAAVGDRVFGCWVLLP